MEEQKKDNQLKIYLANPRGFCAGVDRAVEIVKKSLQKFGAPIYVRHEIVHNKHVVQELKEMGTIFVDELDDIEDTSRPVIFSAHGVAKKVVDDAKFKNLLYIDATCPLVSKVHREAEQLNRQGYHIFLIGHENHPEVIGTMGQIDNNNIELIQNKEDVETILPIKEKKYAYITQTTLSIDDTKEIIQSLQNKFPRIKGPIKEDICYATTNRQAAVKLIAPKCDLFLIIGSRNSSNSQRLVEVAKKNGCENSLLLHTDLKFPEEQILNSKNLGLSSGASAPEILIQNLIKKIRKIRNVQIEEVTSATENVTFKIPSTLQ
jgi:4-hydroxy-3-methylbut-2-enyl diphosphate reductase